MTAEGAQGLRARRRNRQDVVVSQRVRQRETRWKTQRYAVPYPVDGPKISLGVAWFASLLAAAQLQPRLAFIVLIPVAAIAGLQAGHAWSRQELSDRRLAGVFAAVVVAAAWFGAVGLGVAVVMAPLLLVLFASLTVGSDLDPSIRLAEVLTRAAVPAGLAAGSLAVLATDRTAVFVALVLLVSAYEAGDFIVGSGSANAVEGPVAGLVALGLMAVGLWIVQPPPFTSVTLPLYAAVAGVCAPLGQIAGSAILPRGDSWAPGLRRLDSYLVSAPLWVLLVG